MKQFSVTYLNYVNKLNIQGLTRIIEVKEVSTMGSTNDKT